MGIYDRDYIRGKGSTGSYRAGFSRDFAARAPVSITTWLVIINVAIFLIAIFAPQLYNALFYFGHFSTARLFALEVWRLLSFQFLHASLGHLLGNMIGLWLFGIVVEQYLDRKRYLAFYLVCGIAGGLMYLVLNALGVLVGQVFGAAAVPGLLLNDPTTPLVGASAGVFGVIAACARLEPNLRVYLFFVLPIRMKWFAYGYVAFAFFVVLLGGPNAGGQAAHIGGFIAGYFFARNHHLLRDFFDVFDNSNLPPRQKKGRRKAARRAPAKAAAADAEIDRILDKISAEGIQSLTPREKKLLESKSRT